MFTPCTVIFKKHKEKSLIETGIMFYWIKEGMVNILKSLPIKFSEKTEAIELMKECESTPGFMFWATSKEGEAFYKEHYSEINYAWYDDVMKAWFNDNKKSENK